MGAHLVNGQTVPPEYQDLYTSLSGQISSFDSTVRGSWNGSSAPVIYAPQLESASSAQYTGLLFTGYYQGVVLPELDELQALGATGVKVQVSFPILYEPFYGLDIGRYQSMASFYQQLAKDVHARGLKLIVESTAENQFPGDDAADFTSYYQTLSWSQYVLGRATNAVVTALLMQPEYMSLLTEPDSEAAYTGQTNLQTVSGATQLLQSMLTALVAQRITGVSFGAGAGTWLPSLSQYIQSFAATSIQYIDIHVYLLNDSYLTNALTVASLAQSAGKPVALSGLWDFKLRDSELGTLTLTQTSGRDPFSFWQPIDTAFLQAISDFSNYEKALFISPFYSQYFFAYLNYDNFGSTPVGPLIIDSQAAATYAELTGVSSKTGQAWLNLANPTPDTTPPATPAPPTAANVFASSAALNWTATSDNVGVAAYKLYRNGTLTTVTSLLTYSDEGLSPGSSYQYTLTAVDASGNESLPSTALDVETPSAVPPSIPTSLQAQSVSIAQVTLTWNASTSGFGVSGYEIYRGPTPVNLSTYAQTQSTSYTDSQVGPSLTYYYAILAYDTRGNHSSLTGPLAVTTPVESVPSTPGMPVIQSVAYNQVNITWPASTSVLSVAGYLVYRGTSPTSLTQVSYTYVPLYVDHYVSPATTYYYAVVAFDIDALQSGQSPVLPVTTPMEPAPTAPSSVTGNAPAYNQVSLSWLASTSVAGIWGYGVYRGTSPTALSAIASDKNLLFTDTNVLPSTAYYYSVLAYDVFGLPSKQSAVVKIVTPKEPPPSVPSKVSSQALAYNNVSVSWTASSSPVGLWGYVVSRGTSPTTLTAIGSSRTGTSYTDTTTAPSTTYYYAVAAYDNYGQASAQSTAAMAATPKESEPSVPSHVIPQALAYNNVAISWTASSSPVGLWGYVVYRGKSPTTLAIIGSSRTGPSYNDTTTVPSTTYYYAVAAYDTYGVASAESAPVQISTAQEPAPSVPSGLAPQNVASTNVSLSWNPSSSGAGIGGYAVYRGRSASSLSLIGTSTVTSFNDSTVQPAVTYYYSVAAYDTYGLFSAQTSAIAVTTP